jgi:amidophosphoribosyltransferase
LPKKNVTAEDIHSAVTEVMKIAQGAYSVVLAVTRLGIFAFRDPHGIRPLVIGSREIGAHTHIMIASESAAFSIGGFTIERDVAPAELLHVSLDGMITSYTTGQEKEHTPCIFEFVYFARPDSLIDDISVHRTRMRLGQRLGKQLIAKKVRVDCVVPIPESARTAAIEIAQVLKVPFREGFVKNRYIGRTFITRGQSSRVSKVRRKLTTLPLELKGKRVLIVDDSIVRGTTMYEIVSMVRAAGAKAVYVASTAPAVVSESIYGIDIATKDELVAVDARGKRKSDARIAQELGADAIYYQSITDLYAAAHEGNPDIAHFDGSCFDGRYITGTVDANRGKERRSADLPR